MHSASDTGEPAHGSRMGHLSGVPFRLQVRGRNSRSSTRARESMEAWRLPRLERVSRIPLHRLRIGTAEP
jgi:hypothetical protein